jgi:anti-sigma factor RsiW
LPHGDQPQGFLIDGAIMKCDELLAAMNEYVDGTIDPGVCEQFEHHLEDCNPCQVVIDNIRQTIQLYKDGQPYEMPPEFQQAMRQSLRDRWRDRFGS